MKKDYRLISTWRDFRKEEAGEIGEKCWSNIEMDTSEIRGMSHGDYWLNNMLFNEDRTQVLFY